MSYTVEESEYIKDQYLLDANCIDRLSLELKKPKRSIIGKLSKQGVYRRVNYLTKRGETPITKLELTHQISSELGLDPLTGLEKAPKNILQMLLSGIKSLEKVEI